MADLTIEVATTCASNEFYETDVHVPNGSTYLVRFERTPPVTYVRKSRRYPGFYSAQYEKDGHAAEEDFKFNMLVETSCAHIEQVKTEKRRCGWNGELAPFKYDGIECPECGGAVKHVKVGV